MSERTLMVNTVLNPKRRAYGVHLELDGRAVVRMDAEAATRHASAVLAHAQQADHDAAVLRQLTRKVDIPLEDAAEMVASLRKTRRLPPKAHTAPLALAAGVNSDLDPFLSIHIDQQQIGQWTTGDARSHAMFVLETIEAARLDTAYLRHLVDVLDLDLATASALIGDLAQFRPDAQDA